MDIYLSVQDIWKQRLPYESCNLINLHTIAYRILDDKTGIVGRPVQLTFSLIMHVYTTINLWVGEAVHKIIHPITTYRYLTYMHML